jgi:hypothetical protein
MIIKCRFVSLAIGPAAGTHAGFQSRRSDLRGRPVRLHALDSDKLTERRRSQQSHIHAIAALLHSAVSTNAGACLNAAVQQHQQQY